MDPWSIIGWAVVAVIAFVVAVLFVWALAVAIGIGIAFAKHIKTREVPPEPGQVWRNPQGRRLTIDSYTSNGRVVVKTARSASTMSRSYSPDEWRTKVRATHLYLDS